MLTRVGDWFYPNTDALGLDEFLWWCHDMNMTALLAVWAGKSYGQIVSGTELTPYVDDIMNELEVCQCHCFGKIVEGVNELTLNHSTSSAPQTAPWVVSAQRTVATTRGTSSTSKLATRTT